MGSASGLGAAAGGSQGIIPRVPAPSPSSSSGLVVPEELGGPGITFLPFLAPRTDREHQNPKGGPGFDPLVLPGCRAWGAASQPWGTLWRHQNPPTSPRHSPVAIAPLPWHCRQGTIAREPPPSLTRAGGSGAPSPRPPEMGDGRRGGDFGERGTPPPASTSAPGRDWGCRGGPRSAPLDGSEPPGQGLSRLRLQRGANPACSAPLPGPGRFLASDLGMWRL